MANVEYAEPALAPWNVSYNNAEEIVVSAATEKQAIVIALERLGLTEPEHPIRAWPKLQEQT